MKSKETIIKTTAIILLAALMGVAAFALIKGWVGGHFNSVDTLRTYIASYGIWAPMILTLIQLLLAVLPICPSFTGCVVVQPYSVRQVASGQTISVSVQAPLPPMLWQNAMAFSLSTRCFPCRSMKPTSRKSTAAKAIRSCCFWLFCFPWRRTIFFAIFPGS